jgi:hypothetical protein
MKRTGIFLFWLLTFIACEQQNQLDPQPVVDSTIKPEVISTTETGDTVVTKSMERFFPAEGIRANASGSASLPEGTQESIQDASAVNNIGFEPNAGVIITENGSTHLMALQLPAVPGSRQVKWKSLGTGWQNSEFMTMDKDNFYVVWNNAVYKNPKTSPNNWSLIIPNNGEDVKGLVGSKSGGYMARGNYLYSFNSTGSVFAIFTQSGVIANTRLMAGYRKSNGSFMLYFLTHDHQLWVCHNPTGAIDWYKPNWYAPYEYVHDMVGNPMTNLLCERTAATGSRINTIDASGIRFWFSNLQFSWWGRLAVNNGYVWLMDNTLSQVMTLGQHAGQSAYSEYGWGGIQKACADPTLVIN